MNYHQSLMNFIINFFFLFASALALFLASLYAKFFFYLFILFLKRSVFLLFLPIRLTASISSGRDTSRPYWMHRHFCRGIV